MQISYRNPCQHAINGPHDNHHQYVKIHYKFILQKPDGYSVVMLTQNTDT